MAFNNHHHIICPGFCNLSSVQLGGFSLSPVDGLRMKKNIQYLGILRKIALTLYTI